MATRSMICMERKDGKFEAIYCHWDGYPSNNGRMLLEHYTDPEKVQALMDLGDISSLGKEIGEKHDFDSNYKEHPDWCCAYGRDREENGTEKKVLDPDDFPQGVEHLGIEYVYLFKDGKWFYLSDRHMYDFEELTEAVCKAD